MPRARLSMRKIRELLRLQFDQGLSLNQAAKACSIARATAQEYVKRFRAAGLPWPLSAALGGSDLDSRLFSRPPNPE